MNDGQGQPGNLAENPRAVTESVSVTVGHAVAILTRDPDNPDDITTNVAIVDTEYYSQIADADNTNTLVNRTRKAKIWYEISEARYADFPRREITLEIGNDKNSDNDPILTFYLTPYNLGVRSTEWDGRFVVVPPENAPTHPYGLFYAHIRLKINRDSDAAWEFNYVSDPHDITVDAWPIANAGGDQTVYVGDTVTLDGSGSYDPDGNAIQTYTWDFDADDDDTTPVTVDTNPTSHAYGSAGSYTVELTVTDNEGRISPRISTMIVAVSEIGVSILNAGNSSVAIDTEYSHNNPNATDRSIPATIQYQLTAGSGDAIAELRFTLEIGNDEDPDTEPTTMVTKTVPVNAGQGLARTGSIDWDGKKIAAPLYGSHNAQIKLEVKLKNKVEWEQGVSRSGFHTINVASFPVADAGEDQIVGLGTQVNFSGSASNDPDGGDDDLTYTWNFGSNVYGVLGTDRVLATCRFTIPDDPVTVLLTVTDDENQSDTDTCTITMITPTGEITTSEGWDTGGRQTLHMWRGRLEPTTTSFFNINVAESDSGAIDTCWFEGSRIPMVDGITGGSWSVDETNTLDAPDNVGWTKPSVDYYRQRRRDPCQFTVFQIMSVDFPAGISDVPYANHDLEFIINRFSIECRKDGQSAIKNY